jgi:hypothetical protein
MGDISTKMCIAELEITRRYFFHLQPDLVFINQRSKIGFTRNFKDALWQISIWQGIKTGEFIKLYSLTSGHLKCIRLYFR